MFLEEKYLYLTLLVGTILSIIILRKNLFPLKIVLRGSLPELMFDNYFNSFSDEELDKEYLSWQLSFYELAIGNRFKKLYCLWLPKKELGRLVEIKRKSKKELLKVLKNYANIH